MTEIHAIQNGNWADASTWDLGRTPDFGDIVYIENYNIAVVTANAEKIVFNGSGTLTGTKTITANLECLGNVASYFISGISTVNGDLYENSQNPNAVVFDSTATFIGDAELHNCSYCNNRTYNSYIFTGNMFLFDNGAYSVVTENWDYAFVINGKLFIDESSTRSFVIGEVPNTNGYYRYISEIESYSHFPVFGGTFIGSNVDASQYTLYKVTLHNAPFLTTGDIRHCTFGDVDIKKGTLTSKQYDWVMNGNVKQNSDGLVIGRTKVTDISGKSVNYNEDATLFLLTKEQYDEEIPQELDVKQGVEYGINKVGAYNPSLPQESTVLKDVEYGGDKVGTLEVIALSGATATADNISVVNLTEQEVERVKNCATVSTVQKCFEDFKE